MGVKLLSKSELSGLKAKAQERDIQEGVKIATRVDGLRELWSKTEQDFELYKTSTLAAIQDELQKATEEKENRRRITDIESRIRATIPGDSYEKSRIGGF